MISFFHQLVNPVILFWIMVGLYLLSRFRGRIRQARFFLWASAIWLFIISCSPLPVWMIRQLEKQFTTLDPTQLQADSTWYIVVLGGGHSNAPDLTAANRLSGDALGRLVEGIRIHRLLPGSKLIFSGYAQSGKVTQAETLAEAALDLGVDPRDTLLLVEPTHTKAEAYAYVARFGKQNQVVLVTSALHLPRAMDWFRKAGTKPVPAPTNFAIKVDPEHWTYDFLPSPRKIGLMQQATHEYAGKMLFWLDGF